MGREIESRQGIPRVEVLSNKNVFKNYKGVQSLYLLHINVKISIKDFSIFYDMLLLILVGVPRFLWH
jgi:hypothetical protein